MGGAQGPPQTPLISSEPGGCPIVIEQGAVSPEREAKVLASKPVRLRSEASGEARTGRAHRAWPVFRLFQLCIGSMLRRCGRISSLDPALLRPSARGSH